MAATIWQAMYGSGPVVITTKKRLFCAAARGSTIVAFAAVLIVTGTNLVSGSAA